MKLALAPLLFVLASTAIAQSNGLDELEARKPKDNQDFKANYAFVREVTTEISKNQLSSADDFYRASKLMEISFFDYRTNRVRYELLLASAAKGSEKAEAELPRAWDFLMLTLGQPMRFDPSDMAAKNLGSDYFRTARAPDSVVAVETNPGQSRDAAKTSKDNAELQGIVDADQKARQNFAKFTASEIQEMAKSDRARLARTLEIVKASQIHTAKDFANAALVMQHSVTFSGYQLAHELAVCSMILGDKAVGRWLVGASYDRMLNSLGHDQRFGTQYGPEGFKITDEAGICDAERLAIGCPNLEQARTRVLK